MGGVPVGTVVYRLAVEQLVNGGGVDSRYSRSVATDVLVAPCDSRGADWPGEDDRRVSLPAQVTCLRQQPWRECRVDERSSTACFCGGAVPFLHGDGLPARLMVVVVSKDGSWCLRVIARQKNRLTGKITRK